jgi:anti-anti-sigma factor
VELQTRTSGHVTTLEAVGSIDTRSSAEFEQGALAAMAAGATALVCDLSKVDVITSAGLRVLVMVGKQLQRREGALVLCGLNEYVRSVFEVSGLLALFTIEESADAARARLAPPSQPARTTSALARHVSRLLAVGDAASGHAADAGAARTSQSALAKAVSALLDRADDPPAAL